MEIEKILRSCLDSTHLEYRYTGSCKFTKSNLNKHRFELLSWSKQPALNQYNVHTLVNCIDKHFSIPPEIQEILFEDSRVNLPPPIIAVEEGKKEPTLKFYSSYNLFTKELAMRREGPLVRPLVMFTGYKWEINNPSTYEIDTYTALPVKSRQSMLDTSKYLPFFHKSLEHVFKLSSGKLKDLLFSEVAGLTGSRKSHEVSLVNETIPMKEMTECTQYLCNYFNIKKEDAEDITEHLDGQFLTFVQGGIDNKGEEFLSYYYGEEDQLM
jgi:hypothetical protein